MSHPMGSRYWRRMLALGLVSAVAFGIMYAAQHFWPH